jgi:hypothetical protein
MAYCIDDPKQPKKPQLDETQIPDIVNDPQA